MKLIINGREQELTVLYGSTAIFTYEGICERAGKPFSQYPDVTVKSKSVTKKINKGERVEIPINETPIFTVEMTQYT